jgi:hypothetical protein
MSEERACRQDVGKVGSIGQEIAACHAVSIPSSTKRRAERGGEGGIASAKPVLLGQERVKLEKEHQLRRVRNF